MPSLSLSTAARLVGAAGGGAWRPKASTRSSPLLLPSSELSPIACGTVAPPPSPELLPSSLESAPLKARRFSPFTPLLALRFGGTDGETAGETKFGDRLAS